MFRDAGRGAHAHMQAAGQDHHAKLVIDLEDAYRGARRSISLQTPVVNAQGHLTLHPHTVDVSILKGVYAGQDLRLAGQSGAGLVPESAGDLYLEIAFREHPRVHIDGRDVSIELPLAPSEAALGAQVTVPTPDGSVAMTVPPNSSGGRRLRLKGKGIPANPAGDLYVALRIVLPPATRHPPPATREHAKALYETIRQGFNFDARAHVYRWLIMTESMKIYLEGQIVENDVEFTLVELCRASGASEEEVVLWVSEGAFEPAGDEPPEWRFSGAALSRVLTAKRLARDFEINAPGIALALDLLDEIAALRASPRKSIDR